MMDTSRLFLDNAFDVFWGMVFMTSFLVPSGRLISQSQCDPVSACFNKNYASTKHGGYQLSNWSRPFQWLLYDCPKPRLHGHSPRPLEPLEALEPLRHVMWPRRSRGRPRWDVARLSHVLRRLRQWRGPLAGCSSSEPCLGAGKAVYGGPKEQWSNEQWTDI